MHVHRLGRQAGRRDRQSKQGKARKNEQSRQACTDKPTKERLTDMCQGRQAGKKEQLGSEIGRQVARQADEK